MLFMALKLTTLSQRCYTLIGNPRTHSLLWELHEYRSQHEGSCDGVRVGFSATQRGVVQSRTGNRFVLALDDRRLVQQVFNQPCGKTRTTVIVPETDSVTDLCRWFQNFVDRMFFRHSVLFLSKRNKS